MGQSYSLGFLIKALTRICSNIKEEGMGSVELPLIEFRDGFLAFD